MLYKKKKVEKLRGRSSYKLTALLISLFMLFSLVAALPVYAQGALPAQESDLGKVAVARTQAVHPVAGKLAKIAGNEGDNWAYYPQKGTKYIFTKDLSEQTAEQLVQQIMGEGIQVLDVRYTGTEHSAGSFTTEDESIIGFNEGVILSTGNIRYVDGPNTSGSITYSNNLEGDQYLDLLIPGYTTYDATIIEFDFIPSQNTLSFDYVFSSEEYNEYVGSKFNDVFGFFLNGKNIALIPDTNIPVAINNVNNQENADYYRDNASGQGINTEMDGLTTVLTVSATVKVGEKNTIRLAIADAGDRSFDSNVFIKGASFTAVESDVLQFAKTSQEVMENDGTVTVTVARTGKMLETVTVDYYTVDGSAKAPADYAEKTGTLVFEPGVSSKSIPVAIVDNDEVGDTKTFHLYLKNATGNVIIGNNISTQILVLDDDVAGNEPQTVAWGERTGVLPHKNFIINFNKEVDPETVTSQNFYVLDENGEVVDKIIPELTFNELSVIMKAVDYFTYSPGKTYTLFIEPDVKSQTGQLLGKRIRMNFTIK